MQNLIELKKFTRHLASLSQKEILKYFRTEIDIDTKADNSPVTIADKKAEE